MWIPCRMLGLAIWLFTNRREVATRNIALSFPERSSRWHKRTAFKSVLRMAEMFFVQIVTPFLSSAEMMRRQRISDAHAAHLLKLCQKGGTIFLSPHCSNTECMSIIPVMLPGAMFSTIYRPLDVAFAERYVRWARSRWGLGLISRREGLLDLRRRLSKGENMGILFDQSSGWTGSIILFFGRVCAATDLPGLLAARTGASCALIVSRRKGFMRSEIEVYEMDCEGGAPAITVRSNAKLEELLRADEELCADWMWAHRRWKCSMYGAAHCLNVQDKKNYIALSLEVRRQAAVERRLPYLVRVPQDRARAAALAEWMPRLRKRREDVRWIMACPEENADLFEEGRNCERLIPAPSDRMKAALKAASGEWVEVYLSLEPEASTKADLSVCKAQYSMGISTCEVAKDGKHLLFTDPEAGKLSEWPRILEAFFRACAYEGDEQ